MDNPAVVDALRRLAGPGPDDVSDATLLARFVASNDSSAFEALVRRHGSLVWGACRRRLRDAHAAEDAFQTTFLALARHAATVRRPDALAAWLHRVAVRCSAALRLPRDHMSISSIDIPSRGPDPAAAAISNDLERMIDTEIDALPEPFREAFVLCEVEQRTAADAAKTLGCAIGTIESRLTRARKWLRARMVRRGVSVGAISAITFGADAVPASARVGAVAFATGSSPTPAGLIAIADRVVRAGLGAIVGVGLVGTLGVVGLGGLLWALTQGPLPTPPSPSPDAPAVSLDLPIPEPEQFRRNRDNFPLPPEAIARVGNPWLRHGAIPQKIAFAGNGRFLASAGAGDRWLRVWDMETGRPRAHFSLAAGESPAAISLTPDGLTLRVLVATGVPRATHLREYDTFRGLETHRRPVSGGPFTTAAFSADSQLLATSSGGRIRVHDANATELWRFDLTSPSVVELAFSANGRQLAAVASGSDRICFVDAISGRPGRDLVDPGSALSLVTVSDDGKRVAGWCATSHRIRIWDVANRKLLTSIVPDSLVNGLAIAPDGKTLASFAPNRPITLWSVEDGTKRGDVHVFRGFLGRFSANGAVLAVATRAMAIQLVDVASGAVVPNSPDDLFAAHPVAFTGHGSRLLVEKFQSWCDYPLGSDESPRGIDPGMGPLEEFLLSAGDRAALSPDRSLIARCTAGNRDVPEFSIDLLDSATREVRRRIDLAQSARRPTFSPDGNTVYAVSADWFVRGWDVRTGHEVMCSGSPVSMWVSQLVVSPDGKHLATAQPVFPVNAQDDAIRVFDTANGAQVFSAVGAVGEPYLAFSPDGKWFAATGASADPKKPGPQLSVWEVATGKLKIGIPEISGQPAFSPDSRTLAVTHENSVVLFEMATGLPRHEFHHHGKVEPALAWRADGRVLAAASSEAPVYLWDVAGDRTGTTPVWDSARDEDRWAALCGSDAAAAFQSLRELWTHPKEAVPFLKSRMHEPLDARTSARVCEALELIATADAMEMLASWASHRDEGPITTEAIHSLMRLLSA
jgi:RNA polymerase sigma factor (sigma-70 family)